MRFSVRSRFLISWRRNTHPWDVSGTKLRKCCFPVFHFKDLSSLKMLAHSCAGLVPPFRSDTNLYAQAGECGEKVRIRCRVAAADSWTGTYNHHQPHRAVRCAGGKLHNQSTRMISFSMLIKRGLTGIRKAKFARPLPGTGHFTIRCDHRRICIYVQLHVFKLPEKIADRSFTKRL